MLPRKLLALEQKDLVPKTSEPSGCSGSSRAAPDDDHIVRIIFYHKCLSNPGQPPGTRGSNQSIGISESVPAKACPGVISTILIYLRIASRTGTSFLSKTSPCKRRRTSIRCCLDSINLVKSASSL